MDTDGRPFLSYVELDKQRQASEEWADQAERRADEEAEKVQRLMAQLIAMGVDPSKLDV